MLRLYYSLPFGVGFRQTHDLSHSPAGVCIATSRSIYTPCYCLNHNVETEIIVIILHEVVRLSRQAKTDFFFLEIVGANTTKIEAAYQTHSEILFGHLYVFLYFCAHQKRAVVIAVSDSSKKAIERNTAKKCYTVDYRNRPII